MGVGEGVGEHQQEAQGGHRPTVSEICIITQVYIHSILVCTGEHMMGALCSHTYTHTVTCGCT